MVDLFNYHRRKTSEVHVGTLTMGSNCPVRIQSMTTTSTDDTAASVAQSERIIKAGGELVRLTTQGPREARNLWPMSTSMLWWPTLPLSMPKV